MIEDPSLLRSRQLVAAALKCSLDTVTEDTNVESIPLWDSLGHMSIILALEQDLKRSLLAEEIAAIASVRAIARIMAKSEAD